MTECLKCGKLFGDIEESRKHKAACAGLESTPGEIAAAGAFCNCVRCQTERQGESLFGTLTRCPACLSESCPRIQWHGNRCPKFEKPAEVPCGCRACRLGRGEGLAFATVSVCNMCGDRRCPCAEDHANRCQMIIPNDQAKPFMGEFADPELCKPTGKYPGKIEGIVSGPAERYPSQDRIKKAWIEFSDLALEPEGIRSTGNRANQWREMRKAFYAGAFMALTETDKICDLPTEAESMAALGSMRTEAMEFAAAVTAGKR